MTNNLVDAINLLSQKLETPAAVLWTALMRQAKIEAYSSIFLFCCGMILTIIFARFWIKGIKECEEGKMLASAIATCLFSLFLIIALCCASDTLSGLYNPEYWAINHLISHK